MTRRSGSNLAPILALHELGFSLRSHPAWKAVGLAYDAALAQKTRRWKFKAVFIWSLEMHLRGELQ